jgi:hypothetical protein
VSTEWYTRLEKGHISCVSEDVLDAVARALQLDDAECAYLFDLARAAKPARSSRRRTSSKTQLRPSVQWLLDSITGAAAFIRNGRMDILGANPSATPCTRPSSTTNETARTSPASTSSTRAPTTSTPTGATL